MSRFRLGYKANLAASHIVGHIALTRQLISQTAKAGSTHLNALTEASNVYEFPLGGLMLEAPKALKYRH